MMTEYPKIIGLTGGIGSGKTTVARMFNALGVPIFIADEVGKDLMQNDPNLSAALVDAFGSDVFKEGLLNRSYIADRVFSDKFLLTKLNGLVHQAVAAAFKLWLAQQSSSYVIKESAILFEHGLDQNCDAVILVTASVEDRLKRCLSRENMTESRFYAILNNQWDQSKTESLADFVITNVDLKNTKEQVLNVHHTLNKMYKI